MQNENIKYTDGKIYKIISSQTDQLYIGSTIQPLSKRLYEHRRHFQNHKEGSYHYVSSFDMIAYDDHAIILIENYSCKTKEQLLAREQFWIDEFRQNLSKKQKNALTDYKAYSKQYYNDHREDLIRKESIRNQKPEIKEKRKQKVYCEYCDVSIGYPDVADHRRAKYHCTNVKNAQEVIATNGEHWHMWWLYFNNIASRKMFAHKKND